MSLKAMVKKITGSLGYRLVKADYFDKLIHINGFSEAEVFLLLQRRFDKKSKITFFDIGANVGQTVNRIKTFYPNSLVFCIEPIKASFDALVESVSENENVSCYNVAFGEKKGETEVFHRKDSEWNSLVPVLNESAKREGGESEKINVVTVDDFVKKNNINHIHFFKTDTEGFELSVLKGAQQTLQNGMIDFVYVEVGFRADDLQHVHWQRIVEALAPYNYNFTGFFDCAYADDLNIYYANALFVRG